MNIYDQQRLSDKTANHKRSCGQNFSKDFQMCSVFSFFSYDFKEISAYTLMKSVNYRGILVLYFFF